MLELNSGARWVGRFVLPIALAATSGCPNGPSPVPTLTTVGLQQVASGLTAPVELVAAPDESGRLFVVDQIGQIRIIDASGNLLSTPLLDVRDRMVQLNPPYDERGLLGLAFHPGFASSGRFFVQYTAPKGAGTPASFDSQTHVSEFRVSPADPDQADPASERLVLAIDQPQANHKGGELAFGPDGFLYIGLGDGGGAGDIGGGHTPDLGNGQDKSKLLGKILRIDVDSGNPYSSPPDNPFVSKAGARPEIWAYGFRNPYRCSFDAGGELFCGDVGQGLFEEVDIVTRGGNYGWNRKEGAHCFDPSSQGSPPGSCADTAPDGAPLLDPIIEYPHTNDQGQRIGSAVIGGFVYRGTAIPALQGVYVFGDLGSGLLTPDGSVFGGTRLTDGSWEMHNLSIAGRTNGRLGSYLFGFGRDVAGELYLLTSQNVGPTGTSGVVYKIVAP